nr:hypothetical protein [Tanacetum cinerariifolium]
NNSNNNLKSDNISAMMSQTRSTRGRENSAQPHLVFTNDNLLTEILIRLPILCIHLFTTVSNQWLQILTSPHFTDRRRKFPILDPSAGIFANHLTSLFKCYFVSLDSRLNSKKSSIDSSFGFAEEVNHVRILHSCNGLLLCSVVYLDWPLILENQVTTKWCKLEAKLVRLRFKFTLQRQGIGDSAETGSATLVLIILKVQSIGMTPSIGKRGTFFESCGCLLFVCKDDIGSTEFTIYEMMKGSSVWSVRYLVNIVQLLNPLPEGWSIHTGVWSICLGEGEEDAFVVINLSRKVVKYNLISNTNTEIFDIGSNQMDDDDDDDDDAVLFIPPFEVDPNLYEFFPSLASL